MKKPQDDPKISYQQHPSGTERCGLCTMFRPPRRCTAVEGFVQRYGWCKIFERKPSGKRVG